MSFLKKRGEVRTSDIVRALNISRQTAAEHLRKLAQAKIVIKMGSTIDSYYVPYRASTAASQQYPAFSKTFRIKGLQEDKIFSLIADELKLSKQISKSAFEITSYAFTEMLNNAMDHSGAPKVKCAFSLKNGNVGFVVTDRGKGAFETIRKRFHLKDHYEAIESLLKGKQTADPIRHSGQGIFFTSKIADRFLLKNARLGLFFENDNGDLSVKELPKLVRGTEVSFEIKMKSKKSLKALFNEYSNEDFEFDKTKIEIRLSPKQALYVSRSEAKRLIIGLDKFRRIELDFSGVPMVGQAFADEIFRVFAKSHPKIEIIPIHMNRPVEFMIKRAMASAKGDQKW